MNVVGKKREMGSSKLLAKQNNEQKKHDHASENPNPRRNITITNLQEPGTATGHKSSGPQMEARPGQKSRL